MVETPRIADYHCGPYVVAAILQDPGGSITAGSGAQVTREIGVRNPDPTARRCAEALSRSGIAETAYLPMNAIPWFDGKPTVTHLREGARLNSRLIGSTGVRAVILCGGVACRTRRWLELPSSVAIIEAPHPSSRGLSVYRRNGRVLGYQAALAEFFAAFVLAAERVGILVDGKRRLKEI